MPGVRVFATLLTVLPLMAQEDGPAFFEKNVRPLLAKQCLGCHSATSQPVMGGLRLDTREMALKGGSRGAAIVPGNAAESLLMKAVQHTAGALQMPPGPKMKDADAAMLAQWIQMGAPWGMRRRARRTWRRRKSSGRLWPPAEPAIPEVKSKAG